jgi:two-component sensor histidine kinase
VLTNLRVFRLKFSIQAKKITTAWTDYSKAIDVRNARINALLPIDDSLYLATDQGVFQHLLTDIRQNPITPRMHMESVTAGTQTFFDQAKINLDAEERYVRFRFVGIAFQAKGDIRYRYRLEPLDRNWNYTTAREVAYPILNYGSYRFVVEASLPDGSWSEPAYTVVAIETPFEKTAWFWLLIAATVTVFAGLFFYLRLTALKARHQLQQETLLFEKKLAELELQALQLQMNPHFIFNAIYAIQGFYASGDKAAAKDYIVRLASLVRMIFESGKNNKIPLQHEIRLLREYVGLFQLRMEVPISFFVDVDPRINIGEVMIPPMLIQPVVENALQYGLAPLRSGARLFIRFIQEGPYLHVTIEDNGVGRAKSARMKFDIPKTSSGLRITEQRIQLLYRNPPDFPVFEIADAYLKQENPGTIVHLRIPFDL